MPLLLPNLDDRTWSDLVAEATSLIPVYGPEWTDQNYSDPGITLVELAGAIAEMEIYQLNQVTDAERLKFLALVGVSPRPPRPAHVVVSLPLAKGVAPLAVPASLAFEGHDPFGVATRYRILRPLTLGQGAVSAVQWQDSAGYHDLTPQWNRNAAFNPFGAAPLPGVAFYLGLTEALPINEAVQLYFTFGDGLSGFDQRLRLMRQAKEMERICNPPVANPCGTKSPESPRGTVQGATGDQAPAHYGVRTVWQYAASVAGRLEWVSLDPNQGQVADDTRAFTLDGPVAFSLPGAMASWGVGAVASPHYYLRCLIAAGSYDAAPSIAAVAFNGVLAEQSVPLASSLVIDPQAKIVYSRQGPPVPYTLTTMTPSLDAEGRITSIAFGVGAASDPQFRVLSFNPPVGASSGSLGLEGAFLGFGDGAPNQQVSLPEAPVDASTLALYTLEAGAWYGWELRPDFLASRRRDRHAVLNPTTGDIAFGNGERGLAPPLQSLIFAVLDTTRAQSGNLGADSITTLADSPHNRAILYSPAEPDGWGKLKHELAPAANPQPAFCGASAETIDQAAGRADQIVQTSGRAVSLADYERLAAETPGARIARVKAIANMHPDFPCFKAPGMIAVIVLPYLPQGSPTPTPGLLAAVAAYLRPRHVIGSRVEVVGPTYLDVAVQATVQSMPGTKKTNLQAAIVEALNGFLDPLTGGPDGTGWPFGRDVYRAEIMKTIDAISGVDYIASLSLLADEGQPQCANVCLGPTWLVQAGAHQITVL